ncbi:hypothetical protein BJ165DRAFT_1592537 [Panaeolus papilionaceus]|nr:hypothetical protein BJ165DRAFT_1592537 [Panaeolus papilionaceus]
MYSSRRSVLGPTGAGKSSESVAFVTTMWDTLHNERTRTRADSHFAQLKDEVLRDLFGGNDVAITQILNTKNSALAVLDLFRNLTDSFSRPMSSASPHLYRDLLERIEGALQVKQMIESELTQPEPRTNTDLRPILERNQRENHEILIKFIGQLTNFGPIPKGFEEAHQCLQASIDAMRCAPLATFLQPPALPANESAAVVPIAAWSDQRATIPGGTTTDDDPRVASVTNEEPSSVRPGPTSDCSPTSVGRLHPSRMLILKGLLRRLIQTAKRGGKKWVGKTKD